MALEVPETVTASTASELFGLDPATLRTWRARGYLPPTAEGWTRFGITDLMQIAALVELTTLGVKLTSAAAKVAEEVSYGPRRIVGASPEEGRFLMVIHDRDQNLLDAECGSLDRLYLVLGATNRGAAAIVFSLEKLRDEVKEKLAAWARSGANR